MICVVGCTIWVAVGCLSLSCVAMSQCLKVVRHGLKVAQRVLRVLCADLRAGFARLSDFTAPKPVNWILESVAFLSVNDQQGFHSKASKEKEKSASSKAHSSLAHYMSKQDKKEKKEKEEKKKLHE